MDLSGYVIIYSYGDKSHLKSPCHISISNVIELNIDEDYIYDQTIFVIKSIKKSNKENTVQCELKDNIIVPRFAIDLNQVDIELSSDDFKKIYSVINKKKWYNFW